MTLLDEIKSGESQTLEFKQNHLNLFENPFEVQFLHLDAINLTSAR